MPFSQQFMVSWANESYSRIWLYDKADREWVLVYFIGNGSYVKPQTTVGQCKKYKQ